MAWLTIDALSTAFGEAELRQLTDRRRTGQIDEDVSAPAIARAESEVEGLLRPSIPEFPTPTIPAAVISAACDIARFYLFEKTIPEVVQARYSAARSYLKSASFRTEELGLPSSPSDSSRGGATVAGRRDMRIAAKTARSYELPDPNLIEGL